MEKKGINERVKACESKQYMYVQNSAKNEAF